MTMKTIKIPTIYMQINEFIQKLSLNIKQVYIVYYLQRPLHSNV